MVAARILDWLFGRTASCLDKMEHIPHRQLNSNNKSHSANIQIQRKVKVILNTIDDDGVVCTGDARQEGETGGRAAEAQQSHDRKKDDHF